MPAPAQFSRTGATELTIVIVSWNTRDLLADCLRSVYETVQSISCQVIIVDNASQDGSAAMVREHFPSASVIENRVNVGFAQANNQAIAQSAGEHIMLLNPDTVLFPQAVGEMLRFLARHPRVGAVGPLLLNHDGTVQPSCHPILTPWREFWRLAFLDLLWPLARYRFAARAGTLPRRVEVLKGACLLLRRAALDQVGLLDESYFMYTEEMDLCQRLALAGWQVYWFPAARVLHYGGRSTNQVAEGMYVELYRSKVHFQRKLWGEPRARLLKSLLLVAYLPRYIVSLLVGSPQRSHRYRQLLRELPRM